MICEEESPPCQFQHKEFYPYGELTLPGVQVGRTRRLFWAKPLAAVRQEPGEEIHHFLARKTPWAIT